MKEYDDTIELRSIQQYLYCPHRFGLMQNDVSWADNVFVNKGNILHERVCNEGTTYSDKCIVERSVRVYNDRFGIFGVLDCLEFKKCDGGVYISKFEGKYALSIVEYKVTSPKKGFIRNDERMQLLGQKICVDSLFSYDCDTYFYYGDTHRRERIIFTEDDHRLLINTLEAMRIIKRDGTIPPIRMDQNCSGCSMKDICLPLKRR